MSEQGWLDELKVAGREVHYSIDPSGSGQLVFLRQAKSVALRQAVARETSMGESRVAGCMGL